MPVYVLDGSGRVSLPRRALAVTADAAGVAVQLQASRDGVLDHTAVHPAPGLMILPRLAGRTDISAVPGQGLTSFPQGTILRVVIGTDSHSDPDPDRAELTPIDVSGLQFVELASIHAGAERIEVSAHKTKVDEQLGPLANQARSLARGVLRQDELADTRKVRLEVNIDSTISMLGSINDGSIKAVVDLLAGIAAVVSADPIDISLLGYSPQRLAPAAPLEVSTLLQAELDRMPLGVGFRSVGPSPVPGGADRWVLTISDSVPADYAATVALDGDSVRRHLVIVGLGGNGRLPAVDLGSTAVLAPPAGQSTTDALLAAPAELSRVVTSMLAGFPVGAQNEEANR